MTTTLDFDSLESTIREAAPAVSLSSDVRQFAVDGLEPRAVVVPSSVDDVPAVLAAAARAGAAVIPWGGGTHMALGNPPETYDLALDLRGLDAVVEYEPADLTVSVEAGMRLSELQRRLAEHGQWLPLDPSVRPEATVGGVLAANVSGPARVRYGTMRDLLIGVRFATPGGEIVHSGGRVVKNVAGYDLGKLQIGALGTLGVIVEATFKVAPLPESTRWLALSSDDLRSLMSISFDVRDRNLAVTGIVVARAPEDPAWTLHIRCAAGAAAVERSVREIEELASAAGVSCRTEDEMTAASQAVDDAIRVRCSVTPSASEELLAILSQAGAAIESYPTAGVTYASLPAGSVTAPELRGLRSFCMLEGRGALVLEAGPPEIKRALEVWGDPPAGFELMQNLKAEFDPDRTLNPGRYLGGI